MQAEPDDMKLYAYQNKINQHLSGGKNIVLQAPTGAGKTLGALFPGLRNFLRPPAQQPQKIIYGVPMRVLARSFEAEYSKLMRSDPELSDRYGWYPRVQMGEQADDPLFEGRLIFATVDQILASFLHLPYGIPRRLDNINAGAFIGSYLIFDEFHLYPGTAMMLSVLAMLKMLAGISRFTLMSATFSKPFLEAIARELGAVVIADEPGTPLADSLFSDVESLQKQARTWYAQDGALDAAAVQRHLGERTVAICNTVERAQALYADVRHRLPNVDCRLLHSRFYRDDRRRIEDWALLNYGKPNHRTPAQDASRAKRPCLLIATQVIEVGLDISSDVMLTECAPAASLIQRAGRCARRAGETGSVHVYQPYDADNNITYAPYGGANTPHDENHGLEAVCRKTWDTLTSSDFNQKILRFAQEQAWINAAHVEHDTHFVTGLAAKLEQRIEAITACIQDKHHGRLGELIRKQTTVPLYIWADKKPIKHPQQLESFSLSRGQLSRFYEALQLAQPDAPFYLAGCTGKPEHTNDDDAMTLETFQWYDLRETKEIYQGRYVWFAAHPQAVAYDDAFGLRLLPADRPAPESPTIPRNAYHYEPFTADRYHEHITGLYWAYTRSFELLMNFSLQEGYRFKPGDKAYIPLRDETGFGFHRLCERAGKNFEQAEQLVRLMLALHDVGKLNKRWQAWAQAWQRHRMEQGFEVLLAPDAGPFAHTDLDKRLPEEKDLYEHFKYPPRGSHAVESAEACLPALWEACGKDEFFFDVVLAAIMHHHTSAAHECGEFEMVAAGAAAIEQALAACGFGETAARTAQAVRAKFQNSGKRLSQANQAIQPTPRSYDKTLMYALFVRVLRLADQRSSDYWRKYGAAH